MSAPTFRFPAVDGELWLGLRPLPIAAIALTVGTAVGALYLGAPLPVGAALLIVGGIVGLWPAGSRPLVEWLPAAAGHLCAIATGAVRWVSPAGSLTGRQRDTALRLPPEYGQLTLVSAHVADGMALVDDRRAGTVTVVLEVAGADRFALAGGAEQARLLTGWGQALTMLGADRALLRVQWVARAGPERRDPAGWMNARQPAADQGAGHAQFAAAVANAAVRHQGWLAVQWQRPSGARTPGWYEAAAGRARQITGALAGAELASRPLPAGELGALLRGFVDPDLPDGLTVAGPGQIGPASRRTSWDALRTDDAWHRSFAVTGWPRLPLHPAWLEPVLLAVPAGACRTLAVHLQPVPAAIAVRQARAARAKARLDAADRARLGMVDSIAASQTETDGADQEAELVAGYTTHRLTAVLTVTAPGPAELRAACETVRAAAATARLDLRPMHGQHDLAFVAALPLCRPAASRR